MSSLPSVQRYPCVLFFLSGALSPLKPPQVALFKFVWWRTNVIVPLSWIVFKCFITLYSYPDHAAVWCLHVCSGQVGRHRVVPKHRAVIINRKPLLWQHGMWRSSAAQPSWSNTLQLNMKGSSYQRSITCVFPCSRWRRACVLVNRCRTSDLCWQDDCYHPHLNKCLNSPRSAFSCSCHVQEDGPGQNQNPFEEQLRTEIDPFWCLMVWKRC